MEKIKGVEVDIQHMVVLRCLRGHEETELIHVGLTHIHRCVLAL